MKGLVFFILLVGAQLIASFPKELPIKDTEIKSQNSRQKRQDRPGLIDFSGTPPERPERPEVALPGGLYPSGPYPKPELELEKKDGLDLDFGADLNLPEDVVKNADIDIGLRLNAMNFGKGGKPGGHSDDHETDCDCIRDLAEDAEELSESLESIIDCLEDLGDNSSANALVRSSSSLTIEDAFGDDLSSTLSSLSKYTNRRCFWDNYNNYCRCCWGTYYYYCSFYPTPWYYCYGYGYYGYNRKRDTHEEAVPEHEEEHGHQETSERGRGYCIAEQFLDITNELSEQAEVVCHTAVVASEDYLNGIIPQISKQIDNIDELKQSLEEENDCPSN